MMFEDGTICFSMGTNSPAHRAARERYLAVLQRAADEHDAKVMRSMEQWLLDYEQRQIERAAASPARDPYEVATRSGQPDWMALRREHWDFVKRFGR